MLSSPKSIYASSKTTRLLVESKSFIISSLFNIVPVGLLGLHTITILGLFSFTFSITLSIFITKFSSLSTPINLDPFIWLYIEYILKLGEKLNITSSLSTKVCIIKSIISLEPFPTRRFFLFTPEIFM